MTTALSQYRDEGNMVLLGDEKGRFFSDFNKGVEYNTKRMEAMVKAKHEALRDSEGGLD
jgi:hypothetical protein